jgi:hypothetical protein
VAHRLIRITTALMVVAVAVVAAVISYQHGYELVRSHAEAGCDGAAAAVHGGRADLGCVHGGTGRQPPNLDYPAGPAYHLIGFDTPTFTPIFVAARLPGWTAHITEQLTANSLIRPLAAYSGHTERHVAA